MNTVEKRKTRLMEELKNKEYREAYVSSNIDVGIAFQIRALRKQRQWTQEKLADEAKKQQEAISALENPSTAPSISNLKKIATAFDVGLVVRFVPFSDMVKWDLKLSVGSLEVVSFDKDPYFRENNEEPETTVDHMQHLESLTPEITDKIIDIRKYRENLTFQQKTHSYTPSGADSTTAVL